jgi:hypothetical protein
MYLCTGFGQDFLLQSKCTVNGQTFVVRGAAPKIVTFTCQGGKKNIYRSRTLEKGIIFMLHLVLFSGLLFGLHHGIFEF